MKYSNDTIGNRNRDLPACSAVPQPTAPSHASIFLHVRLMFCDAVHTDVRKCVVSEYRFDVISKEINILTSLQHGQFLAPPSRQLTLPKTLCTDHAQVSAAVNIPVRLHGAFVSILSLILVNRRMGYPAPIFTNLSLAGKRL